MLFIDWSILHFYWPSFDNLWPLLDVFHWYQVLIFWLILSFEPSWYYSDDDLVTIMFLFFPRDLLGLFYACFWWLLWRLLVRHGNLLIALDCGLVFRHYYAFWHHFHAYFFFSQIYLSIICYVFFNLLVLLCWIVFTKSLKNLIPLFSEETSLFFIIEKAVSNYFPNY